MALPDRLSARLAAYGFWRMMFVIAGLAALLMIFSSGTLVIH